MVVTVDMEAAPFVAGCAQPYLRLRSGVVHAIKWQLQHRYMQVEAMAELLAPANEADARQIASAA